jgi:hypothetical protein
MPRPTREQRFSRTRARQHAERARFGHKEAVCLFHGPLPHSALVDPAKAARLIEQHHLFGRQYDPNLVVSLCLTCHKAISMGMLDEGWEPDATPNPLDTADMVFRALSAFFRLLADALARVAERIADGIRRLDTSKIDWRAVVEARP